MFVSQWYYKPGPLKAIGQFSRAMKWQIRDAKATLCSNDDLVFFSLISSVLGLNIGHYVWKVSRCVFENFVIVIVINIASIIAKL